MDAIETATKIAAALQAPRGTGSRVYQTRVWQGPNRTARVYVKSGGKDIGYVEALPDGSWHTKAITRGAGDVHSVASTIGA